MNKSELIARVAEKTGLGLSKSGEALDGILESIIDAMNKGESVTLVGFGTFSVKERAARNGYNPSIGKKMQIPAKTVVKFTPGCKMRLKQE